MSIIIPPNFENSSVQLDIVSMKSSTHLGQEKFVHEVAYKISTRIENDLIEETLEIFFPLESTTELPSSFTNYESLTKNQVLDWVRDYAPLLETQYSHCWRILEKTEHQEDQNTALPW